MIFGCPRELTFIRVILQSQHDEIEAKFFEERAALEAKYQKLYEPLYAKVRLLHVYNVSGEYMKRYNFCPFPYVQIVPLFCVVSEV